MFIELIMLSNHLILCRSLLLPPIFSSIRVFSNELVLRIGWPKYWSFSFSINPSNEYSGLISFGIDWFDLLAIQRTLKSLLQHRGLWHASLPCPPPSSWARSNSCPLSRWCHPTISSSVVPFSFCFNLSQHRVFSSESTFHIRWLKYWSYSISPSNEYAGLISFRVN